MRQFEDLFPSGRGRPSIPASVMASILVLQTLHDLSDRETAEAARCDLRWKVATVGPQRIRPVHAGVLAVNGWPSPRGRTAINEAVRRVVADDSGSCVAAANAVDSTILADAVATQDTITRSWSRRSARVGRDRPGDRRCTGRVQAPAARSIDWDEPGAKDALVSALVQRRERGAGGARRDRSRTGSRWPQRWHCWRWWPVRMSSPPKGPMAPMAGGASPAKSPPPVISTVDRRPAHPCPPRRAGDGTGRMWPREPETGIITDEALTKAAGTENSDPGVAERFLAADTGDAHGAKDAAPHHDGDRTTCAIEGARVMVRRFRLRHGGSAWRDQLRRAPGGDQTQAVDRACGGRVHRRHYRRRAGAWLPGRSHPPAQRDPGGQLRCAVPRLPAA